MVENKDSTNKFEELRHQAEELIKKQTEPTPESPPDIFDLIHELRIYQAELEIQNEELQRSQQELSVLQQKYQNLYEFAPCGYLILNKKGIITDLNLTGSRLLETERSHVSRVGFSQLIDLGWENAYLSARAESTQTGQKQSIDLPIKRKKGPPLWVQAEIQADRNEVDEVLQWRIVLLDISEKKKALEEKEKVQIQLQQARKMESIGTLAGGIAHEFNNMLAVIMGFTELAAEEIPDENPAKGYIEEILTTSLNAKEVVKKLLNVAQKMPTRKKPVPIATLIKDSLNIIRETMPATIEIRQNIRCSDQMILGDATEISKVLMHLCTNAAHAMREQPGVLTVGLEAVEVSPVSEGRFAGLPPGHYARLKIADTGKGIKPDIMDRLFDPYFTTKDVDEGLGLGLAVVHGILKEHNGSVRIESKVGKGTTVEVLLSLTEEQAKKTIEHKTAHTTGTERIMLVDDEVTLVKMVTLMLERSGYEVVGKTSSLEALETIKDNPDAFDLVITDMALPGLSGDRLAQGIKQIRENMPVILCTGHSELINEKEASQLGINAFAMKPLGQKDLLQIVRRVLDETKS